MPKATQLVVLFGLKSEKEEDDGVRVNVYLSVFGFCERLWKQLVGWCDHMRKALTLTLPLFRRPTTLGRQQAKIVLSLEWSPVAVTVNVK
jgi:hypothetical protein